MKLTEGQTTLFDLIRGVAAQAVLIGHGISFFGIATFLHQPNFPWMQNIAVVVFFVLSGFLITYSVSNKKNYNFSLYLIDRFSRIYTVLIPCLFLIAAIDYSIISLFEYRYFEFFNLPHFVGNVFMLQDFPYDLFVNPFGSGRVLWTLAVEWWIYLFYGYLIFTFLKKEISFSTVAIMAVLSIVPAFHLINGRGNGLMAVWLFGSLIFIARKHVSLESIAKGKKILIALTLALLAAYRIRFTMQEYDVLFAFILSLLLFLLIDLVKDYRFPVWQDKAIRTIASYSYTLYVLHYSILEFVLVSMPGANPYLLFSIGFVASNIITYIVGIYIEIRLTRKIKTSLKERYKRLA